MTSISFSASPTKRKRPSFKSRGSTGGCCLTGITLGPVLIVSTGNDKTCDGRVHASKDIAETAARDLIEDHNKNCDCGTDLGDHYLGAYEEGKSPP